MNASIFFTAAIIRVFRSFGFLVTNLCNHGERYKKPCIFHGGNNTENENSM
jgi:hypothetical protein